MCTNASSLLSHRQYNLSWCIRKSRNQYRPTAVISWPPLRSNPILSQIYNFAQRKHFLLSTASCLSHSAKSLADTSFQISLGNQNFCTVKNVHCLSPSADPLVVKPPTFQKLFHVPRAQALGARSATIATFEGCLPHIDQSHVEVENISWLQCYVGGSTERLKMRLLTSKPYIIIGQRSLYCGHSETLKLASGDNNFERILDRFIYIAGSNSLMVAGEWWWCPGTQP